MAALKDEMRQPASPALEQLSGLAAQTDATAYQVENPAAAPGAEPSPGAPDYTTEAKAMTDMVAAMICGYEPKCLPLWDEDRKAGIAAALAPVMEKYSFTLGAIPPEITLLIMVGPPLYQSSRIIAESMNRHPEPKRKDAGGVHAGGVSAPDQPTGAAATGATHSVDMMALT